MKLHCSYCGEEFERETGLVFCKPSHKVNYHRLKKSAPTKEEAIKEAVIEHTKVAKKFIKNREEQSMQLCSHGSMKGLCKHGCK